MLKYRRLEYKELDDWFQHCEDVFGESKEYFKGHWDNDPWKDINGIFVAVDNDKIVSTVRVFIREIYFSGKKIKMGGIGEVCTRSNYRGQGIASSLLKIAISYMTEEDIKISILFGDESIYSKLGWKQVGLIDNVYCTEKSERKLMIREVNFRTDLEDLMNIHHIFNSNLQLIGPVIRNNFYWNNWITNESGENLIALNNKGEIVAYLKYIIEENTALVGDYGSLSEDGNIIESFMTYLFNKENITSIKISDVIKCNLKKETTILTDYYMVRLINPFDIESNEINNTHELINYMKNSNNVFWKVDCF